MLTIPANGQPKRQDMACADAERIKATRLASGETVKTGRNATWVTLEFKTAANELIRMEASPATFKLDRPKVGDTVMVAYDRARPRTIHRPSRYENLDTAKWIGIAGVVLLWLGGVLRKAGGATKNGLSELAEALRKSAESVAAQKPTGKGGFAAMDRTATASAAKPPAAVRGKTPARAPARTLPKGTPCVVSPRRHGLLGLFR